MGASLTIAITRNHTLTPLQPITPHKYRLLALVVGQLCQKMPTETRDRLLFPLLFRPLLLLTPDEDHTAVSTEFDEATVERALTDLHVLVTAAPLLPATAELLAVPTLILPFLDCWAFARRSKARGLQEAEESLVALLRGVEERAHVLLVEGYLHLVETSRERTLAFVAGGTGGVARRWRVGGEEEEELAAVLGAVLGGVGSEEDGAASALQVRYKKSLQSLYPHPCAEGRRKRHSNPRVQSLSITSPYTQLNQQCLTSLGPASSWLPRHLRRAESVADDVVALLRAVGHEGAGEEEGIAGGMVPGRVMERLMLAYLALKVKEG